MDFYRVYGAPGFGVVYAACVTARLGTTPSQSHYLRISLRIHHINNRSI
jgi:hypothetical protein